MSKARARNFKLTFSGPANFFHAPRREPSLKRVRHCSADVNRVRFEAAVAMFAQVPLAIRVCGRRGHIGLLLHENLFADAQGRIISNTGNTLIVNGGNGVTRSIISGRTEDGQPYVRDVEERYVGNMLYHNESNYNPITKTKERICWKVDLTKQGASREALEAC